MASQGFFGSALDANVVAPVRVRGEFVRTDLYAASSARPIASLGAGLITTIIAAGLFGSAAPATAQDGYGNVFGYDDHRAEQLQQRYRRRAVRHSRAPSSDDQANTAEKKLKKSKNKEAKKSAPQGAVYAIVSLADQHVTVYDSTGRIAQSRISTGMPGHPTPIGLFSIIGKERWHRSNIYSGAPMPFMQRITWSGVAMHLGVVPGYPASHGCIRLPDGFAQQFWGMTQIGSRVVVARRDTTAVEISSTFLPVPKLRPAPEVLPGSQQSSLPSSTPVKLASISEASPMSARRRKKRHLAPRPPRSCSTRSSTPRRSRSARWRARPRPTRPPRTPCGRRRPRESRPIRRWTTSIRLRPISGLLRPSSPPSTPRPRPLLLPRRRRHRRMRPKPSGRGRPLRPPQCRAPRQPMLQRKQLQRRRRPPRKGTVDRARAALVEAQSREATKRQVAFAAVQTWKDAVAAGELAADTVKEAERRLKPASVLFSKKEGRVFIRQDRKEVYEAPITFKDPDRPIGTHLFIAVNGDADGKVKWSAISVPSDDPRRKRSKNDKNADPAPAPAPQADTASVALDRVEVADNVRERIAELVWVGAQVIVTDNARSDEMDDDTDIIVSTR